MALPLNIIQVSAQVTGLVSTSTVLTNNLTSQFAVGTALIAGPRGQQGIQGIQGIQGQGIPTNGQAGQILYSGGAGNAGYWGNAPTYTQVQWISPDGTVWTQGITNAGQPTWTKGSAAATNTFGTAFGMLTLA